MAQRNRPLTSTELSGVGLPLATRGYDCRAVDELLDRVVEAFEAIEHEAADLRTHVRTGSSAKAPKTTKAAGMREEKPTVTRGGKKKGNKKKDSKTDGKKGKKTAKAKGKSSRKKRS